MRIIFRQFSDQKISSSIAVYILHFDHFSYVFSVENQVFQFFVRAVDHGTPAMHSDVSVDVYIMSSKDVPPVFERNDEKSISPEEAPIGEFKSIQGRFIFIPSLSWDNTMYATVLFTGSIVAKVKLVTDVAAKFRLLSNANLFSIDNNGQISLTSQLDREKSPFYVIGVLAYTDSSPPLTALSEVYLQVIDSNDNVPDFENEVYSVSIAENMPEGTSIVKGIWRSLTV